MENFGELLRQYNNGSMAAGVEIDDARQRESGRGRVVLAIACAVSAHEAKAHQYAR